MKPNPKVGQTLYYKVPGLRRVGLPLQEVTVTKVGKKYFYASGPYSRETAFHLYTWREKTEFSAGSLYESERDYLNMLEKQDLIRRIEMKTRYGNGYLRCSNKELEMIYETLTKGEIK